MAFSELDHTGIQAHDRDRVCRCAPFTVGPEYTVTTLNDGGTGSLREAVEASGERIVTFNISGNIELTAPLQINNPNIEIDGSTAPNGGICLKNYGLTINADNVHVHHIRIRPGAGSGQAVDSLYITGNASGVLIDHCSLSWSVDENLSIRGQNIEIAYCIISEALRDSVHPEGGHSKNAWWAYTADNVKIHHCLIAHAVDRNMLHRCGDGEFINNVQYNVSVPSYIYPYESIVRMNYIGNTNVEGTDTWPGYDPGYRPMLRVGQDAPYLAGSGVYLSDNICGDRGDGDPDEWCVDVDERGQIVGVKYTFGFSQVVPVAHAAAYADVLANAGATLPKRDAVDSRIASDVGAGTGTIIDDPSDVGGWPDLTI